MPLTTEQAKLTEVDEDHKIYHKRVFVTVGVYLALEAKTSIVHLLM
jgi:hypothetical protein